MTGVWKGTCILFFLFECNNLTSYFYKQRIVFLVTCALFTVLHLGGALGHNAATLLSTRMLAGIFGSARTYLRHPPLP